MAKRKNKKVQKQNTNSKPNKKVEKIIQQKYMELSSEDKGLISTISSPFLIYTITSYIAIFGGILFLLLAYFFSPEGLIGIYYEIFGYIGIVFGIFELFHLSKKKKAFKEFLKRDQYRLIWNYSKEDYDEILDINKETIPKPSTLTVGLSLIILVLLTFTLYFSMGVQSRLIAIPFGLVSIVILLLTSYYIPKFTLDRSVAKPYLILIDDNAAYFMGQFFTWSECEVKLNRTKEFGKQIIVFNLSFKEKELIGNRDRDYSIILPNENEETIILARSQAKRINRQTREFKENPENKGDFLDRFFRKLVGR